MGNAKNLAFWAILILLLVTLFSVFQDGSPAGGGASMSYTQFLDRVEQGDISSVVIDGETVSGRASNGERFQTIQPNDGTLMEALRAAGVDVRVEPQERGGLLSTLGFWLPMLIIFGIWIFFLNRMQGGGRGAMGFGKSRAKLLTERTGKVTFDDVAGIDEAKEELEEIVEFLRDPQKYSRLGGKIPKGALLVGPPGTGKTLLARAIAGEAGVPFFTISGSDFVEMFVGVGASRVRDMFEQAKKNAPCIVFIDEIDAVGRHRGVGYGGGNDEREQTLNQLLVEMDGFEANEGVILIAATNRPDVLDPALLRPGRFDRQVTVPNPDVGGREKILAVHARKVPLAPNVDLKVIARGTPGFSGADLANLVNEAALTAARADKRLVTMEDFERAKDKVMMGAERRSLIMTEDEKKLTAYHEAGHAIVGMNVPDHDPIHKATIIPRGRALGLVLSLPERDHLSISYRKYKSKIAMAMGGKVAEELTFGPDNVTSGATSDIQQVSKIARAMVTQFGMSEKLGNVDYADQRDSFLGVYGGQVSISTDTQRAIEEEVKSLIDEGYETAKRILTEKHDEFVRLAEGLLEYETLTGDEIRKVIAGEKLDRSDDSGLPPAAPGDGGRTAVPKAGKPKRGGGLGDGGMEPQPN
ncbi:ATP-dependent zinc metalloprotease FtsH [Limibaculum sp. M0105]|uniref:ATP-dependent zinc metalloprotease FtsH n=1 Tax=Thermohalobaculum xanthum TaxID=2753746 RepID=A0A8J7M6T9_9RHOB|nr:ATP-dependent zinc metalloprotease FtsH [Thermohalobaculum xanthum]MBK0399353.1 ATP-dependent zinc metalloprotease FtsH [Thermohalobaculum xanthum]